MTEEEAEKIRSLVSAVLMFEQNNDERLREKIIKVRKEIRLQVLENPEKSKFFSQALAHVNIILKYNPRVEKFTRDILGLAARDPIKDLRIDYLKYYAGSRATAAFFFKASFGLAFLLVGMIGFFFYKLRESNVALTEEITVRKSTEDELRKHRENLAQMVAQRTQDLTKTTQRLEARSYELERSNKALQEFAFIASHDLKEPLRKIETFSSMLREECGQDLKREGLDYLGRMESSVMRMRAMIEGLLNYQGLPKAVGILSRSI